MTCLACQHWSPKQSGRIAQQGFALCAIAPEWKFFAPQHTCPRHKPATDAIVSAREAWLASLDRKAVNKK